MDDFFKIPYSSGKMTFVLCVSWICAPYNQTCIRPEKAFLVLDIK